MSDTDCKNPNTFMNNYLSTCKAQAQTAVNLGQNDYDEGIVQYCNNYINDDCKCYSSIVNGTYATVEGIDPLCSNPLCSGTYDPILPSYYYRTWADCVYCENNIGDQNIDSSTNVTVAINQLCNVSSSTSTTSSSSLDIGMGLALSNLTNFDVSFTDYLSTNWLLLLFILLTIILIILAIFMMTKATPKSTTPTPTK